MKICMIIPFKYNWSSFSSTRSTYEYLSVLGHTVNLFNKHLNPKIEYNQYDQIWLMGAGTKLSTEEFENIKAPVIAFGLSDPNLFDINHMLNCDVYCTNDLETFEEMRKLIQHVFYNPTSCDKIYHQKLTSAPENSYSQKSIKNSHI